MKIIEIIEKEKREEAEIIEAIGKRAERLASMTADERAALDEAIMTECVEAYNFCRFGN